MLNYTNKVKYILHFQYFTPNMHNNNKKIFFSNKALNFLLRSALESFKKFSRKKIYSMWRIDRFFFKGRGNVSSICSFQSEN